MINLGAFVMLSMILLLGLGMRYMYRDFPMDEDYGFWAYPAHFRNKGVRFVRDYWGSFFPLLIFFKIWLYKICKDNLANIRLFFAAYNSLTAVSLYVLASYLAGNTCGLLAAFFFTVFSSVPQLGSYSINTEKYYVLPSTLSTLFLLMGLENHGDWFPAISGAFLGIAFLLKPVLVVSLGAFLVYILMYGFLMEAALFSFGFAVILALHFGVFFFLYRHDLGELARQSKMRFVAAFNYIGSPLDMLERFGNDIVPVLKETLFVWVAALPFIFQAILEGGPNQIFLLLWMVAAIITLVGQKAFWQYQYIPLILILSLFSAISLTNTLVQFESSGVIYFFGLILLSSLIYSLKNIIQGFWLYSRNRPKFFNSFRKSDQYFFIPEIAKYIRENSYDTDCIYAWGNHTQIYLLSGRTSCEKSVSDFVGPYKEAHEYQFDETIKGIMEKRPKFIVQILSSFDIDCFNELTGLTYKLDRVFYNRFMVYKLSGENKNDQRSFREDEPWELKKGKLDRLSNGLRKGRIFDYYLQGKMDEKYIKEFDESLALNPYDVVSLVYLAVYYKDVREYEKALDYLKRASRVKKHRAWVYLEMAFVNQSMENTIEVERCVSGARNWIWPYSADSWKTLCVVYRLEGNPEKSIRWLKFLLRINPPVERLYFDLGISLREAGRIEESIEALEKELRLFPQGERKGFELGMAYLEACNWKDAINCMKKEISLYPSGEWKHFMLGKAFQGVGKIEEAIESLSREIEMYPNGEWKHFMLGKAFQGAGKIEEAIESLSREIELYPKGEWKHFELGIALREAGRLEEAIEQFVRELSINPNAEGISFELGITYGMLGRLEEGLKYLRKELKRFPGRSYVFYHLASFLKKKGDLEEAAEYFKKVARDTKCPANLKGGAGYHLGTILEQENKKLEALSEYRKCLELIPGHKKASEQVKALT